ncbi:B12-binding domain-containing radical SAM protein [Nonomuraea glycinis]|uniref:B12-binding domain-containing radical SAM protein n=1 Tax=Nonomuraea glycinis TaxID=2047744 RepID=A0A918ADM2_9ACTN|nr:radical SAM protein [Nonomuraea glycinis]MCA2182771.1 B12-binding domain-containing radical SAM protein [Nonomuraea glycinis]GGP17224.1 B12-binding domain-containing radical SAM protein [Nonomuraea glycinis]
MKVALLYPEVYDMARFLQERKEFPPFGVLYLAAVAEEAGHQVEIRRVAPGHTALDLSSFDAVGFSLASSATYGLMLQARRDALIDPDALVMVGGVHANFYPAESLTDFSADVVADGESEDTILELLDHAYDRDYTGVTGVLFERDGQIVRNASRPLMRDIDTLPLPARHLLPRDDIVLPDRLAGTDTRMAHVMFSRGCPFPCSFCAVAQRRMQYRGGISARTELTHLIDAYGIGGFAIVDDNFIVNKGKVADICKNIADLNLRWSALSRVDTVDQALLDTMAASGCIEIKYGMESGSERLLKAMRKNTTQAKIRAAVEMTAKAGIQAKVFIIHGFPGENTETTYETIALLQELRPMLGRVALFRFVPLPGTEVYDQALLHRIRGTHRQPDWDGDWAKFHIHHNERHWWGNADDWAETERSYAELRAFVEGEWGPQG